MSLRILIVDDHAILREGVVALLRTQLPTAQLQEAADGIAAVRSCKEWSPDVVLMDISLPHLSGLDATRQILEIHSKTRILMLSAYGGTQLVTDAMRVGALGFVTKERAFEEVITAIRAILAGEKYLSKHVAPAPEQSDEQSAAGDAKAVLTLRERDVLELLANGEAMKEVARHLGVSIKTVETHRRKIMDKLGIYNIAELTKYALREGLTPLYGGSSNSLVARVVEPAGQ